MMRYCRAQQIIHNYKGEKPVGAVLMSVLLHGIIIISLLKFIQASKTINAEIQSSVEIPVSIVMVQKPATIQKQKEIKKLPLKTAPSDLKIEQKLAKIEPSSGSEAADTSSSEQEKNDQQPVAVVKNASINGQKIAPVYPRRALQLQQEGTVILHILVDQAGKAVEVKIVESSGFPLLDKAAFEAVSKWSFNPSTQEGIVIKSWVEVPVSFSIKS